MVENSNRIADPVEAAISVLFDKAAKSADLTAARKVFTEVATANRPWEQLPSRLKSAARADAKRVLGADLRSADALVKAGYSARAAANLLRDIGRA